MDPIQQIDLEDVKRVGIAAAYQAAEILQAKFGKISRVRKKGVIDLVTEADTASEERILQVIRSRFPDHGILAEESGRDTVESACTWIIDPLDGTTNYAHRIGMYAVSIAFAVEDDVVLGIVLNPVTGELFTATAGGGAACNERPIRVSEISSLTDSLLVTGFPYDVREDLAPVVSSVYPVSGSGARDSTARFRCTGSVPCSLRPVRGLLGGAPEILGHRSRNADCTGGRG